MKLLFLISLVAGQLHSASTPDWLRGTWRDDSDRTQSVAQEALDHPIDSKLSVEQRWNEANRRANLQSDLKNRGAGLFLSVIGPHSIIIDGHYEHSEIKFRVLFSSENECTLKLSDGSIQTFHRDGCEFFVTTDSGLRLFYHRVP